MTDGRWMRAGLNSTRPLWGFVHGLQVGIWPASIDGEGDGGPRGLLRIGSPILQGGTAPGLVNFIAIEPIVDGRRGYSELERSARDGEPGRIIWSGAENHPWEGMDRGKVERHGADERLRVNLFIEKFDNGAHPSLELEFRADRPDEVRFTVRESAGSAPMDFCVLTATMGNYGRLRKLWLRDGIVTPERIWPGFAGDEFTGDAQFPGDRVTRISGEPIVCATSDETDPGSVPADPAGPNWHYRGAFPVTQYWRKPRGSWREDLRVRVNARRLYWATHNPIPGGMAFENFELSERYFTGQSSVFGVSRKTPAELGIPPL